MIIFKRIRNRALFIILNQWMHLSKMLFSIIRKGTNSFFEPDLLKRQNKENEENRLTASVVKKFGRKIFLKKSIRWKFPFHFFFLVEIDFCWKIFLCSIHMKAWIFFFWTKTAGWKKSALKIFLEAGEKFGDGYGFFDHPAGQKRALFGDGLSNAAFMNWSFAKNARKGFMGGLISKHFLRVKLQKKNWNNYHFWASISFLFQKRTLGFSNNL